MMDADHFEDWARRRVELMTEREKTRALMRIAEYGAADAEIQRLLCFRLALPMEDIFRACNWSRVGAMPDHWEIAEVEVDLNTSGMPGDEWRAIARFPYSLDAAYDGSDDPVAHIDWSLSMCVPTQHDAIGLRRLRKQWDAREVDEDGLAKTLAYAAYIARVSPARRLKIFNQKKS